MRKLRTLNRTGLHPVAPASSRPGTWPPHKKRRKGSRPGTASPAAPKPASPSTRMAVYGMCA
ncbi:hypothetical protein Ate01nite_25060 [Actinoplanes teichomyceticus]|nr:hypothetical protein Ate01nite_25060 [Actinoplanes teichomyceticus]